MNEHEILKRVSLFLIISFDFVELLSKSDHLNLNGYANFFSSFSLHERSTLEHIVLRDVRSRSVETLIQLDRFTQKLCTYMYNVSNERQKLHM